jgi:hypothetical protein
VGARWVHGGARRLARRWAGCDCLVLASPPWARFGWEAEGESEKSR